MSNDGNLNDVSLENRETDTSDQVSDTEDPTIQMSYHNNKITYKVKDADQHPYTVKWCRFTIDNYSITSGQDPKGKIARGQERTWYNHEGSFNFEVGRKGNSSVASFWRNNFGQYESTFDHYPGKLNFAFYGPLDIQVQNGTGPLTIYRIAKFGMGQGHAGTTNNWWIAARGARQQTGYLIVCEGVSTGGEKLYFTFRRGGSNTEDVVDIKKIAPSPTF